MKKLTRSTYLLVPCCLIFVLASTSCSAAAIDQDAVLWSNESASQLSIAPLNPAFVQYMEEQELNNEVAPMGININSVTLFTPTSTDGSVDDLTEDFSRPTGLIPSPVDLSHLSPVNMQELMTSEGYGSISSGIGVTGMDVYPSRYDLRDINGVTGVRDQGTAGSCWAHGSLGSLESYLMHSMSEEWDFSENNVKNILVTSDPDGFDRSHDGGGFELFTAAYLARWSGPVLESEDPYNCVSGISPDNATVAKHVQEIFILPGFESNDTLYKWLLINYGAISVQFYYDGSCFDPNNNSYYYSGEVVPANHAIPLVGWDDNYDKDNFIPAAPGNGAFILKNSWGDNWGEDGYFYVSYHDTVMGNNEGTNGLDTRPYISNFMFTAENVSNYDRIYQYDPLGWDACAGYDNITAYGANVFTAGSNETLEAVSFYTVDSNSFYNISVYLDPEAGPTNIYGPVSMQNGSIPIAGYHTIDLDTNVSLLSGQNFSVVVRFTTPNYNYPIAIEMPVVGYTSNNAHAEPGQSYMSRNGVVWEDISESDKNICIKAFTTEEKEPQAAFVSDTRYVHVNETVGFHDASLFSPDTWQWDFGDGCTSANQDPLHAYTTPGIYNVSLNVSNPFGSDTSLRISYIHVINSTIVVNSTGSADFTTISQAVDAASDGDTILVEPGVYKENIWFADDNISLISSTGNPADVSILSPESDQAAINIAADNITISGFNIADSYFGIYMYFSQDCSISNCSINGNMYGLFVAASANNYFADNSIENNTFNCRFGQEVNSVNMSNSVDGKPICYLVNASDLAINTSSNAAFVHLINCSNITIQDLETKNNYYSFYLYNSNNITISNCTSADSRYGVYLSSSVNNTIHGCSISEILSYGLSLISSGNNLIYNNYFNNSNNAYVKNSGSNGWNITMATGSNIIGGNYIGGNFWAKPDGTGWSQTQYSVGSGFCQPYELTDDSNNVDLLPLTGNAEQSVVENVVRDNNAGTHVRIATRTVSPENVAAMDSSIRFVGRDAETHYVFTDRNTPVTDIRFKAETNEGYVMATVSLLNKLPENAPISDSIKVYRSMDIVLGNDAFPLTEISEATITFAVPKEWMVSNSPDKESIHMQHFSDGVWNRLPTAVAGEDDEYVYFEATTTGFSPFVICADVTNENTDTGIQDSEIIEDISGPAGIYESIWKPADDGKGSQMLILPALVLVTIYIVYRKKKI